MKYLLISLILLSNSIIAQVVPNPYHKPQPYLSFFGYFPQDDTIKYYWSKQIHFEKLRDAELAKINSFKNPTLTKKAIQLTDSVNHYKELLKKLKQ